MNEKEKFDSVILAGGFGKRLEPLTDSIPKPLLPIFGVSAFERNIELLRKHGFRHTAVTTMYLPEKLESLELENVEYLRETQPKGSAGAVADIKDRCYDCLLILSGDAVCNFDLKRAREEFIKSGCDAAMLLTRSNDSGEFGSVCVSKGQVVGLCEKPSVRDTLSDLINTGIYFLGRSALDMIPENSFYDFARDLFPALLRAGKTIAAIEPEGHWFDIGSFGVYHQCNMWFSDAKSCIGKHTSIHPAARIEHSVILDNCTVGNSVLKGCIVGEGAVIGNDCIIPPGCVIGPGAELRDNASLAPGTIVPTGATLIGDSYIDCFRDKSSLLELDDDCVVASDSDDGYFVRLGRLFYGSDKIIAFAEGGGRTLQQACEFACGVAEAGNGCTVIAGGDAATASFAAAEYRSKTAYISQNGKKTEIRLFSESGMPFSRESLRELASRTPHTAEASGSVYLLPHGALVKRYLEYLNQNLSVPKKISVCENSESNFLRECAEELGIRGDDSGEKFCISENGSRAAVFLDDGRRISYWQLIILCCIEGKRRGIILPNDTPETVERILRRYGVDVAFYGDSESDVRMLAESDRLHRDGIMLALTAKSIAEKKGMPLSKLCERLPKFSIITRSVFTDRGRMAAVISEIREGCGNARCAGFEFGDGRVNVYASAHGAFRLIAEATDSETAEEIALRAIDKLTSDKK
ncbi:MAG: hypothetical protein E7595_07670 [Ruminococcaceae bacterium]|nr:hypothetical protein [Oscillospiraceae bacterium]